jgi:MerR family transcriptional regulator, light-induced transcriptional regulator
MPPYKVAAVRRQSRELGWTSSIPRAAVRSPGGFRLYSEADAQRVRRMLAHLAGGLPAAEAARAVLAEDGRPGAEHGPPGEPLRVSPPVGELSGALRQALDTLDEPAAQAVLDRLLSDLSLGAVLRDVVVPYLSELGERWQQGTASIAQEHFASNVTRGRLAELARGWGEGHGSRAVLACPPGELHDLALMVLASCSTATGGGSTISG